MPESAMTAARTTIDDLLESLAEKGVQLWEDGGRLRFRAPTNALSDADRDALRAHRDAVLRRLGDRVPTAVSDPGRRHEEFPLTDVQSAYLLGRGPAFAYGGVACHAYLEVSWPDVDPDRLERAWNALVARHDMLRAVVDPDGSQHVRPTVPHVAVPVADLRTGSPEQVAAALDAVRAELDHDAPDPASWPLVQVRTTRTPDGAVLHISNDFLVADWASIALLVAELETLHDDPDTPLTPVGLTFRDYLLAERALRDTPRHARDRAYWTERVDDLPPAPDLPLAPGHADAPPRFHRHTLRLDLPDWEGLRARARAHGVTPTAAVLAAYAAVIGRWSRGDRFTLNLTVLNRLPLHPDVDRVVGDFTSVSLLAVEPAGPASFAEHAAITGARLFDDLDHRLHSGVEVLREVARRRGRDAALMPVVFTGAIGVGGSAAMAGRLGGHGVTQTPQVFIDCQAGDDERGLQVNWDVRDGVFPEGVVPDMVAAFGVLLRALAGDDAAWAAPAADAVALPTRQRAERDAVNATGAPVAPGLLQDAVLARAARHPDRPAVIGPHGTLDYAELVGRAAGVAAELRTTGVGAGDRVAIVMDRGPEQVVAALGVLLSGAAYLPVDTVQPAVRRDAMLHDGDVAAVLTQSWVDAPEGALPVDTLGTAPWPEPSPAAPDDPAYVIYTSGSTGRPKGVVMSHAAALNTIVDVNRRFGVGPHDRVLGLADLGFDLSVYDVFGTLAVGGALVLPDPARRADPSHWAQLVVEHGVTVWNSVPALLQMLTGYLDVDAVELPTLRLALLSGDWIPVPLPATARRVLPRCDLVSLGGATEAAIWSIYHRIGAPDPAWPSIPYGRPLTGQSFRVLDAALRDAPVWTVGELYISGAGLATGYLGDPELTAARFVTHPDGGRLYRTGDLGRYRPGCDIEFLGREDTQVKIRGHRVELGEVEAALLAHPGVAAAAAVVHGSGAERRLLAAVAPGTRADPPAVDLDRIARIATAAGDRGTGPLDGPAVTAAVHALDAAVLASMVAALRARGLFGGPDDRHTVEEIAATAEPRHRWLVRRWVEVLRDARLLEVGPDVGGPLRCPRPPEPDWATARARWAALGSDGFASYVQENARRLPDLLTGAVDPLDLLFSDAEATTALYREHVAARHLNPAAAAVIHRAAAAHDPAAGPLRVVEVGAGTGGTTGDVLDALAGFDVDYLFTDAAPFFLPAARTRFADRPHVRFAVFDVDADPRAQGIAPHSADVVLAAGVLENARDVDAALGHLAQVVAPGGWLVLTEPTREHPWILASQAFLMTPPEDDRASGPSYLDAARWSEKLAALGGPVLRLPADDHPLAATGLHLYATRLKADRVPLRPDDLGRFVATRLPAHMVPARLHVVDALPLTGNGKVDRADLAGWDTETATDTDAGAEPLDEVEAAVAAQWAESLALPRVGRTDDLFARGADSLIMAQAAGRLRERLPEAAAISFDALLRRMLAHPTVADIAAHLRAPEPPPVPDGARADSSNALLVPFGGAGAGGDGPLRVLFHAGLGTMECYRPLAARLVTQDRGPVVGIAIADPDAFTALDPREAVVRAADDYTGRLVATGHTRFQLVGYCLGGMYATEVARRLTERGLDVVDLVLVSSHPVVVDVQDDLMIETVFVPNLHIGLGEAGFGPVDAGAAVRAFGAIAEAHGGRMPAGSVTTIGGDPGLDALGAWFRSLAAHDEAERLGRYATAAGLPAEMVTGMHRMFRQSFLAARFTPPPYVGDIRFLRPTGPFAFAPGMDDATLAFWREVCLGRFTLTDIGGDHFSCVEDPVVAEVAGHVAAGLGQR